MTSTSLPSPAGVSNMSPAGLLGSGDIMPASCNHGDWEEESIQGTSSAVSCHGGPLSLSASSSLRPSSVDLFCEERYSSLWKQYVFWGLSSY